MSSRYNLRSNGKKLTQTSSISPSTVQVSTTSQVKTKQSSTPIGSQAKTTPLSVQSRAPSSIQSSSSAQSKSSSSAQSKSPSSAQSKSPSPIKSPSSAQSKSPIKSPSPIQSKSPSPIQSKSPVKKLTLPSEIKQVFEPYNNVNETQCNSVITEIEKILSQSNTKKQIKNPFNKNNKISYNGSIVKQILSTCYNSFDNLKDKITKIVDNEQLIDLSVATQIPVIKSPIDIFNNLIKNQCTIESVLRTTKYLQNSEPLLICYQKICENIQDIMEDENKITFGNYFSNILHTLIETLYNIVQEIDEDFTISFLFFDEKTRINMKTFTTLNINIYKKYVNEIIYERIPIDTSRYNNKHLMINTILNKSLQMTIKKEKKKIFFKTSYDEDEDFIEIDKNDKIKTFTKLFDKYVEIFHMYNTVLPKYHIVTELIFDGAETKKNNLIYDFIILMTIFNSFSHKHPDEYNLVSRMREDFKLVLETLQNSCYPKEDVNKLLFVLINNCYNVKHSYIDYYYYFKYDGPFTACSFLNFKKYIKDLHQYQPIMSNKNTVLANIETSYKGVGPLFSKDLNIHLYHFILNNDVLPEKTKTRLENVFSFLDHISPHKYNNETFFAFHGTQNLMHKKGDKEICLLAFLSCSFNIYVSLLYATNQNILYDFNKKGIVYVLKIDNDVQYINFCDKLYQMLLLPGTKITIDSQVNVGSILYVFCTVQNSVKGLQYCTDLRESIKNNCSIYTIKQYLIQYESRDTMTDFFINKSYPTCKVSSSTLQKTQFRPNIYYIYKDNDTIYTSLAKLIDPTIYDMNSFFNIKYTFHQMIINECYKLLDVNCINSFIYCDENSIFTAWDYDENYSTTYAHKFKYNTGNFFVDCLMSNYECFNCKNYLQHKTDTNIQLLVWFKSCGMYDTYGLKKINFNMLENPIEHIIFLKNQQGLKQHFKNKDNIHQSLEFFITKLKTCQEKLQNDFKKSYMYFLNTHMPCLFDSDKKPLQEYKEIEKMINMLIDTLLYRIKYYIDNQKQVIEDMHKFCNDITKTSGGRNNLLLEKNMNDFKTLKSDLKHSKSPSISSFDVPRIQKHDLNHHKPSNIPSFNANNKLEHDLKNSRPSNIHIIDENKRHLDDIKNIPFPDIDLLQSKVYTASKSGFDIIAKNMAIRSKIKPSRPSSKSPKSPSKSPKSPSK